MSLVIKKLTAKLADSDSTILNQVNLAVSPGEVHVLMGPNGSGKSTLAKVLLGHPDYEVTNGSVVVDGVELLELETAERARTGLFLAHQYPVEVPGVSLAQFLRLAYNAAREKSLQLTIFKFRQLLREYLSKVNLPQSFIKRNLNEGFSGGEKKKCEILQLLLLDPKYAILDETDSGLDIEALKVVFKTLAQVIAERKKLGVLIITHYQKVFDYINPDFVHVFSEGRVVKSGGKELVAEIEEKGYSGLV
jgi:Fe-S cluster assembly ATP-binding protein